MKPPAIIRKAVFTLATGAWALTLVSCAGVSQSIKPDWNRGIRFERVGVFELQGTSHEIFPLLCPVEEYQWLPDWKCTMFYSDSGVAEKNAMFQTTEMLGKKVTWTNITYEPDHFIEYLLITGVDMVRLSIKLDEVKPGVTKINWRMLFSPNSTLAKIVLPQAFSEANYQKMMDDRQKQLNHYLKYHKLIGKE